jgi:hypothetical protein
MADCLTIDTPGKHESAHDLIWRREHRLQVRTHSISCRQAIDCYSQALDLRW